MDRFLFNRVLHNYRTGKSVPIIARELDISPWTIYKYFRKYHVQLRKPAESNRLRFEKQPLSFTTRVKLSRDAKILKTVGLILYLAEGYKRGKSTVDLANSDPRIVKIFVNFLRQIYQVDDTRFRILLYCYKNQSVNKLIDFWSALTHIGRSQFTKPYIRHDYREDKIGRMPYGMVHIRYNDQRLLSQIKQDIERLTNRFI